MRNLGYCVYPEYSPAYIYILLLPGTTNKIHKKVTKFECALDEWQTVPQNEQ